MTDTNENPAFLAALKTAQTQYRIKNVRLFGVRGVGKGTFLYYLNNSEAEFLHAITCAVTTLAYPEKNIKFHLSTDSGFSMVQNVWDESVEWEVNTKYELTVLCFAVSTMESFECIVPLYKPGMIILGLKCDLPSQVPMSVVTKRCPGAKYIKVSSKTRVGFDLFNEALINSIKEEPKEEHKEEPKEELKENSSIIIEELESRKLSPELRTEIKAEIDYIKSRLNLLASLL